MCDSLTITSIQALRFELDKRREEIEELRQKLELVLEKAHPISSRESWLEFGRL